MNIKQELLKLLERRVFNAEELVEEIDKLYKQEQALQLQQTGVISCLFEDEKLKIAWTVLEWVGYERGFEFDDDNIMEVLMQNSL